MVDSRTLSKVLDIQQKNSRYLKELVKDNKALKQQMSIHNEQLEEILKVLNNSGETSTTTTKKGKGKGKEKQSEEFYQVSIRMFIYVIIYMSILNRPIIAL
jgi:hypothetical protein